ncbi:MAG: CotH kinase family protein [Flavobacteriales bacterium]
MKSLIPISILYLFSYTLDAQVIINEYSAANFNEFTDNYGDFEDWFELHNPSANSVDLNGYYLSDKEDNLTKWQFTSPFVLNSNEYRVIYCSGRNEIIGNDAHTSFKLHQTKGNEWIILTDPDGVTVVDSIFVRPCQTNASIGRENDSGDLTTIFTTPTPSQANTTGFSGYAIPPTFSPQAGVYNAAVNVTIDAPAGATIYYTTDGSFPDNTDIQYTTPVAINTTTVLKAVVYESDPNILPSFIEYGTYFVGTNHTMKLMSVSGDDLSTLIDNGNQIEPWGSIELYNSDGTLIDKARGEFNEHGNDSWAYAQRGFDYITRDQFGYNYALKGELFNDKERDKFQRLIVKCGANDNYPFAYGSSGAHIRDPYIQSLSQVADLRLDERSYEPCILYLNGEYWGVYEIREKVDDLDFTDYYYDQDSVEFLKTWGGTWVDVLVDDQNPADVQNSWNNLRDYIVTNDMSIQANYEYVKSVYNTGSLIDYFILNTYTVNADWLNWNTAWWHGLIEDGDKKKWRYVLWDMDNTFDHGANYTGIPNTDADADPCDAESLGNIGGQGHILIWNALIQNENFFNDYINRWANLSNSSLSCEFMLNHLDSLINTIEPEMQQQIDRWGGTYNEWMDNVDNMRSFMLERCNVLNSAIVDCYDVEGPYNVNVVIEGIGEVEFNNYLDVNEMNTPQSGVYFGGVPIEFIVTNGNFTNYEIISNEAYVYNPNDSNFTINLISDITIVFYFNSNDITFIVEPPNTGSINIDGTVVSNFPHSVSIPDGSNLSLSSLPNTGWELDYWSSNNHNLLPNNTADNITTTINNDDTITLFLNRQSFDITYIVEPSNADIELDINDEVINSFPYTTTEFYNTPIELFAKSNLYWEFLYFTSTNGYIPNQSNSPIQNFIVDKSDTIIIHYDANIFHAVEFQIVPPNTGTIRLNDTLLQNETQSMVFADNESISLQSVAEYGWRFSHWTIQNNTLSPNTIENYVSSQINSDDLIIANFEELFEIFIPNSFTPSNGDFSHNTFDVSVYSVQGVKFKIEIFNRFGERVFLSNDHTISWDGTYKDIKAPVGVYVYNLEVTSLFSGETRKKTGSITLLR